MTASTQRGDLCKNVSLKTWPCLTCLVKSVATVVSQTSKGASTGTKLLPNALDLSTKTSVLHKAQVARLYVGNVISCIPCIFHVKSTCCLSCVSITALPEHTQRRKNPVYNMRLSIAHAKALDIYQQPIDHLPIQGRTGRCSMQTLVMLSPTSLILGAAVAIQGGTQGDWQKGAQKQARDQDPSRARQNI